MMASRCNTCGAYFTGSEAVCAHCGVARTANAPASTGYGPPNQPQLAQPLAQQCSTCGRYFSGSEAACLSCNTPRGYNQPLGGLNWQQNQTADALLMGASLGYGRGYYSPQRMVRRWIFGRLISWAIALFLLLACGTVFFIALLNGLGH